MIETGGRLGEAAWMRDWGLFVVFMLAVNALTIAGVIVWLSLVWQIPVVVFWIVLPLAILALNAYAYTLHKFLTEKKFGRLAALALLLPAVTLGPYAYLEVTKPNWSLAVATDKPVYALDENVQITVTLENRGYFAQSVTSSVNSSLVVWVERLSLGGSYEIQVWCTPYQFDETRLAAASGESIVRTYVWNQTDIADPLLNSTHSPGSYRIWVSLPQKGCLESAIPQYDTSLKTWIDINVTAAQ